VSPLSVSTVIPTYERAGTLRRAIDSARADLLPADEILVVDDGSSDGTEALVRSYPAPVRYFRTPRVGAGAARNAGVRAARGDLVAFLDSDDAWLPGKLALQRAVMERHPDVLFAFSDFASVSPEGEVAHRRADAWRRDARPWDDVLGPRVPSGPAAAPPGTPDFAVHVGRLYEYFISHWPVSIITLIARRVAAGDALHFAEDVPTHEEIECIARLAARGPAAFLTCETAVQHRHPGPRLTDATPLVAARSAATIIERVWGADGAYLERHRGEYEAALDAHRERAARELLALGRTGEARRELGRMFRPRRGLTWLSYVPGGALRFAAARRRRSAP